MYIPIFISTSTSTQHKSSNTDTYHSPSRVTSETHPLPWRADVPRLMELHGDGGDDVGVEMMRPEARAELNAGQVG